MNMKILAALVVCGSVSALSLTSSAAATPATPAPNNPAAGNTVNFTVALKNQGTVATAAGAHGITLTVVNSSNVTVATLTGTFTGTLSNLRFVN